MEYGGLFSHCRVGVVGQWTAFLENLGIRPARSRDGRHTAATLLKVQRVVMSMFGWTSPAMTTRYQHVVPELVEEANRRMGELLGGSEFSGNHLGASASQK